MLISSVQAVCMTGSFIQLGIHSNNVGDSSSCWQINELIDPTHDKLDKLHVLRALLKHRLLEGCSQFLWTSEQTGTSALCSQMPSHLFCHTGC